MRGGSGKVHLCHYWGKDEMQGPCRLCAKVTLPPGASIGLHEHAKEDEIFIITQGEGYVSDGTNEKRIQAGDSILTGSGTSHAIRNCGTENLVLIACILCYEH